MKKCTIATTRTRSAITAIAIAIARYKMLPMMIAKVRNQEEVYQKINNLLLININHKKIIVFNK